MAAALKEVSTKEVTELDPQYTAQLDNLARQDHRQTPTIAYQANTRACYSRSYFLTLLLLVMIRGAGRR